MKTLIFCTSYSDTTEKWTNRHLLWLKAITRTPIKSDKILIVDDGSPRIPYINLVSITRDYDLPEVEPSDPIVIQRFSDNLGRVEMYNYPGWYRSFTYAALYAKKYGYEKVIHVESDAFIISEKMCQYMNDFQDGWETPLFEYCNMPETAIQIIAGSGLEKYYEFIDRPYSMYVGRPADPPLHIIKSSYLPYTVNTSFKGTRLDDMNFESVPKDFDYVCQISNPDLMWWLD